MTWRKVLAAAAVCAGLTAAVAVVYAARRRATVDQPEEPK